MQGLSKMVVWVLDIGQVLGGDLPSLPQLCFPLEPLWFFLCFSSCSPACLGPRSPTLAPLLLRMRWALSGTWAPYRKFAFQEKRLLKVVLTPEAWSWNMSFTFRQRGFLRAP